MWPFSKREEKRAITHIDGWEPWGNGGTLPAVGQVTVDRALSLVPVFGAARLLGDSIASLTPVLYTQGSNAAAPPVRRQTPSLFVNPSVHGTLFDWLHRAVISMALQGDAIGLITARDYYGFPTMIEWLKPDEVGTQDGALTGPGSYMNPIWYWKGRQLNPEDIVHIPWFSMPYRVRGLSPIGAFAVSANIGLGAGEFAAAWFNNGGVPPGTFRNSEQLVTKEDADLITNRFTSRLQQRKPLVFGRDWEYTPIAVGPHEAQFVETMRLTATQIAVIYGIPPEKIGGSTGSSLTYSTVEQNSIDFVTFSLRPWLVRLEAALSKLFPRGTFVKFATEDLIRADAKTRAEIDVLSLGWNPPGWKTINEVRAGNDLEPKPDGDKVPQPPKPPAPAPNAPSASPNGAKPLPLSSGN